MFQPYVGLPSSSPIFTWSPVLIGAPAFIPHGGRPLAAQCQNLSVSFPVAEVRYTSLTDDVDYPQLKPEQELGRQLVSAFTCPQASVRASCPISEDLNPITLPFAVEDHHPDLGSSRPRIRPGFAHSVVLTLRISNFNQEQDIRCPR